MNVFKAISTRRSIRKFQKKTVDEKLIGVILHMAVHAPSAGNLQDWEFVVVEDEKIKERLARAALMQEQVRDAPVVIVVCTDLDRISLKYGKRGESVYSLQDTAAATTIMLLTANALGLGANWVGSFDEDDVKDVLNLPDNLRPVVILPIGYPAEEPEEKRIIPFENVTHVNQYGNKLEMEFKPIANALKEAIEKLSESEKIGKRKLNWGEIIKKMIR